MANDDSMTQEDRSPWTSTGFVVSVLFLGVIIIAALGLLIFGGGDDSPTSQAPPPTDTTATTETTAGASVCGLPAGPQDVPAAAPPTTWEPYGLLLAPTVDGIGPGDRKTRLCFAHSPRGAVTFAANYLVVTNRHTDWQTLSAYIETSSPEIEEFAKNEQRDSEEYQAQIAGYRVAAYSGDQATVEIALRVYVDGQSGLASIPIPLIWSRGDWKVYVTTTAPETVTTLQNLSGFVPWKAGG